MRELPELPKPAGFVIDMGGEDGWSVHDDSDALHEGLDVFTADQMRSFARQAVAAAMERAAKIAEAQVDIYNQKMAQARSADRQEAWERAYNHHDAANYIAAAIRAEIEKDPK